MFYSPGQLPKITVPPGMKVHWFNDVSNRVELALAAGWTPLKDEDGQPIVADVGNERTGPLLCHALTKAL